MVPKGEFLRVTVTASGGRYVSRAPKAIQDLVLLIPGVSGRGTNRAVPFKHKVLQAELSKEGSDHRPDSMVIDVSSQNKLIASGQPFQDLCA